MRPTRERAHDTDVLVVFFDDMIALLVACASPEVDLLAVGAVAFAVVFFLLRALCLLGVAVIARRRAELAETPA